MHRFGRRDPKGAAPMLYVDGAPVTVSATAATPIQDNATHIRIGNRASNVDGTFEGIIDGVRLGYAARPPSWIAAQYQSMTDATVTYGPEEQRP